MKKLWDGSENNLQFGAESSILDNMDTDFKRIDGEHSIQQDVAAINPDFPQPGHISNCGHCAVAYALRRKGYDVEARPSEVSMSLKDFKDNFEGVNLLYSRELTSSDDLSEVLPQIERDILSWGDGANGFVDVRWKGEIEDWGHFFSVEVSCGRVMFVDGQNNEIDVKKYFARAKLKPSIVYGRLDNLRFTNNAKNSVRNRRQEL